MNGDLSVDKVGYTDFEQDRVQLCYLFYFNSTWKEELGLARSFRSFDLVAD